MADGDDSTTTRIRGFLASQSLGITATLFLVCLLFFFLGPGEDIIAAPNILLGMLLLFAKVILQCFDS